MSKKEIGKTVLCLVLLILLAYVSMFPGYGSATYWMLFPILAAFLMTGPVSYVMHMKRQIGSTILLPLLFFIVAKLIGELKFAVSWVPFICIILLAEIVRDLIGPEKDLSIRIAAPIAVSSIAMWNNGFYFGGEAYLKASIADMGETYIQEALNMSTPLVFVLVLLGALAASAICQRITEKLFLK